MKKVGDYKGIPLFSDPEVPPGQMFMLNNNFKPLPPRRSGTLTDISEKPVGAAGFSSINYRGVPIAREYIDEGPAFVNVDHFYRGIATDIFKKNPRKGRHACLMMGYWCWENFKEHPFDLLPYLRKKARSPWLIP